MKKNAKQQKTRAAGVANAGDQPQGVRGGVSAENNFI